MGGNYAAAPPIHMMSPGVKMAALTSGIIVLHFCAMGGDMASIFIYVNGRDFTGCKQPLNAGIPEIALEIRGF